jgi:hypothetical protein
MLKSVFDERKLGAAYAQLRTFSVGDAVREPRRGVLWGENKRTPERFRQQSQGSRLLPRDFRKSS